MKKLLVVLLSLGLIVAFGATASAQPTVKFGGSYYVVGIYDNNPTLNEDTPSSRANFFQRLRLQPEFTIAPGLVLTTRMDALEKMWGNTNWRGGTNDATSSRANGTGTQRIQENIEFERAYVTFTTGIGQFQIGYQSTSAWGTQYADSEGTNGARAMYAFKTGPLMLLGIYEKTYETNQTSNVLNQGRVDADNDNYALAAIYNAKGIEAGFLARYYVWNAGGLGYTGRAGTGSAKFYQLSPYMKATFGPVFVESEINYWFGKARDYEDGMAAGVPAGQDVDLKSWSAYLHAKMNFGPAYAGAMVGYATGDDGSDPTEQTTNPAGGGTSWNPALMLMNDDYRAWIGDNYNQVGTGINTANSQKFGTLIGKIYGGFNPTPKLNLELGLTYAEMDEVSYLTPNRDSELGMELDFTATYKIFDNLSYMVGAGYLWTGDWYKGAAGTTRIDDDYMLMNKLTLSF